MMNDIHNAFRVLTIIIALATLACDHGKNVKPVEKIEFMNFPVASSTIDSSTKETESDNDVVLPIYEIVEQEKYDKPSGAKTQIQFFVIISGTITEPGIRQLLLKLYEEARMVRGFKYHNREPTHIAIWLYPSLDHYKSDVGQQIATLERMGKNSEIRIKIDEDMISQINKKPETKFGLSETRRKEIFEMIVAIEDRANAEAEQKFPEISNANKEKFLQQFKRQDKERSSLTKKYMAELSKKLGIKPDILKEIKREAFMEDWAIPPLKR